MARAYNRRNQIDRELIIFNRGSRTVGTDFLTADEFDDTDSTYYFYGGLTDSGAWKINRYHKTTFAKEYADVAGNPTMTTLALAWIDRLTLAYT